MKVYPAGLLSLEKQITSWQLPISHFQYP